MPTGPKGERRPADVIGNAVKVMRIATGEIEDNVRDPAKELHRKGGLRGGKARAASLSSEERKKIAAKAHKSMRIRLERQRDFIRFLVKVKRQDSCPAQYVPPWNAAARDGLSGGWLHTIT